MQSVSPAAVADINRRSQTASPSPLARNPVSLRLYKVLGATFDDDATREALSTLSDLYSPSGPTPAAKQDDVSHDEVDDADREKIKGVPSFLRGALAGDTAAKARKHLRRDIESKLEEGSLRFLAAFGAVDQKLDALQAHITAMRARCEEAQAQLQSTDEACKSLLDRAGSLRDEQQEVKLVKTRQCVNQLLTYSSHASLSPTKKPTRSLLRTSQSYVYASVIASNPHGSEDRRFLMGCMLRICAHSKARHSNNIDHASYLLLSVQTS